MARNTLWRVNYGGKHLGTVAAPDARGALSAAEMRAVVDGLAILPHAKSSILRFAEDYDRLAERVT